MSPDTLEFSRLVEVSDVPEEGISLEVSANEHECAALADRFGLLSLDVIRAVLELRPVENGLIKVTGLLKASLMQTCVVTLEPVRQRIEEQFVALYGRPRSGDGSNADVEVDVREDGPPEPIVDDKVELGEMVAEHLALSIDPYPRAAGVSVASLTAALEGLAAEPNSENRPFAALARLKQKE